MTAKSRSRDPRSEKPNLPSDIEGRIRLRACCWLEAEMLGARKEQEVRAGKTLTRDQAVGGH